MQEWYVSTKQCATCVNWGGRREVPNQPGTVNTENQLVCGECYINRKFKPGAYESCSSWSRWPAIK